MGGVRGRSDEPNRTLLRCRSARGTYSSGRRHRLTYNNHSRGFRDVCRGRRFMAQVSTASPKEGFGATMRRDLWWAGPLATFLGLLAFLIYANYIILFVPGYFEIRQDTERFDKPDNKAVAPYLAPFHAPLIYDAQSHHAWIQSEKPGWWPGFMPFNS